MPPTDVTGRTAWLVANYTKVRRERPTGWGRGACHLGCIDLDNDHLGEELDRRGEQVASVRCGGVFLAPDRCVDVGQDSVALILGDRAASEGLDVGDVDLRPDGASGLSSFSQVPTTSVSAKPARNIGM